MSIGLPKGMTRDEAYVAGWQEGFDARNAEVESLRLALAAALEDADKWERTYNQVVGLPNMAPKSYNMIRAGFERSKR